MHGVSIVCADAAERVDAFHGDVWAGRREDERLSRLSVGAIQGRDGDRADEGVAVQPRGCCFVLTMSQAGGMTADGVRCDRGPMVDDGDVTSRRRTRQGSSQRGERTHGHTREASPVMGIDENGLSHRNFRLAFHP